MSTELDKKYLENTKSKELKSHVQPLLLSDNESSDDKHVFNYMWYFYASLASIMLGTKMMLITYVKCAKMWIFFIEHMAIWITCILVIIIYYQYLRYKHISAKAMRESYHIDFELFSNKKQAIWGFIAGAWNATGNVFIIFSLKHAYAAGTSPSTMTAIVMFNVLLILIAGITLF